MEGQTEQQFSEKKRIFLRRGIFPPLGMRIIKSAVAVAVCFLVSFLRGNSGIVFYSQLAALWCMQEYVADTKKYARQRFIGTVVGAMFGLLYLLLFYSEGNRAVGAWVISLMIIAVLYTTVLMKKKQASYFSCVVFLSIAVNHVGDQNPYLFVWNRFLDTMIGIVIGVSVNCFSLPRKRRRDILFLSGLDDTLLYRGEKLSDYSRVELNRMLDEGLLFTVSTRRTPASLLEPVGDIRLKMPVIAMDGAVLYNIQERRYIFAYVISREMSREILELVHRAGLTCFVNVIVDDTLVIYYRKTEEPVHCQLVEQMRRSPLRNYVERQEPSEEEVVYFMLLYPRDTIEEFYGILEQEGMTERLKVQKYDSQDYPGYAYIKIYNKNATREHMLDYLKASLGIEKTVTFGSIPGKCDVRVEPGNVNQVVSEMRRRFEPVIWSR